MPNRLTRQRKIHGNNTSIFGNRYSENLSREALSTTLKLSFGPFGLCVSLLLTCASPRTLCVSPLRHCTASGTLCVTLEASAWMTQSLWPLCCLCWALHSLDWLLLSLSLLLCWSPSIVSASLPRTHCPTLLITDSTLLSNPALAK